MEVYSEKLPYVRKHPAGALISDESTFLNFRTCPFWRNCIFAHIWSESWPIHADVLRRLLGKALGFRLLKCISWKTFNLDNYGAILFTNPDNYNNPRLGLIFGFFEIFNFGCVEIVDMTILKFRIFRQNFEFWKLRYVFISNAGDNYWKS